MATLVRKATHAGSWYSEETHVLNKQLSQWLEVASSSPGGPRAIIAPHAGYQYCGANSAYAYKQVNPDTVKRVFLLGPSHHFYLNGCGLTRATHYQTPFYDIILDQDIMTELRATNYFTDITMTQDEREHSLELHLPFIAKVMESRRSHYTLVPIMVGSINADKEAKFGNILAKYLADPQNLFVISSDFCHWGSRFSYTYYDKTKGSIWESIEDLDKKAIVAIETMDPKVFHSYMKQYENTICGRHPIAVLLNAILGLQLKEPNALMQLQFLKYSQSSQCTRMNDSSVSYAAASFTVN